MKVTIKAVLWTKDKDINGECPIALSISGGGKRTYYNTKIKCPESYWDGKIKKGVEHYDIKNTNIEKMMGDARREVLNMELQGIKFSLEDVKRILNPTEKKSGDFLQYFQAYIDNLKATKKQAPGTIAVWDTQYKELKTYTGGKLSFNQVTADFLNKYHAFLAGHEPAYEPTTIFKKLKKIRQIIHKAVDDGHVKRESVKGFEMIKYQEPETDYLTLDQVKKLEKELYAGKMDYSPTLRLISAYFLLECYSGIRWSDWGKFEVEKLISNRNLKVRTTKNKQPVYLDLSVFKSLDKVVKFIAKSGYQFNETEKTTNATLKSVGVLLGLKFSLSTHDGRRTCATLLGEKGYSTRFIAEVLGITENTAKRYVKVTRQSLNEEMKRLGGI